MSDHWLKDIPFFREQIAANKKQTPYGEGLPAPWAWLEAMCDVADTLRAQLSEAQARLAEIERQDPIAWGYHLNGHVLYSAHKSSATKWNDDDAGNTFPVYAAPASPAAQVAQSVADGYVLWPANWKISRGDDPCSLHVINIDNGSGCRVCDGEDSPRVIPAQILYSLCNDLLAAPVSPAAQVAPLCHHEAYQGRCIHCDAKFVGGHVELDAMLAAAQQQKEGKP